MVQLANQTVQDKRIDAYYDSWVEDTPHLSGFDERRKAKEMLASEEFDADFADRVEKENKRTHRKTRKVLAQLLMLQQKRKVQARERK